MYGKLEVGKTEERFVRETLPNLFESPPNEHLRKLLS